MISELIIEIRTKMNITQELLAHKIDVVFVTINMWRNVHYIPLKRYLHVLIGLCIENGISHKKCMEVVVK